MVPASILRPLSACWLRLLALCFLLCGTIATAEPDSPTRWTSAKAEQWAAQQPWLVGANFLPSDAINQLEMWQPDTFDPVEIDRELGWAESIGMNTMRVFLHDLLWQQDAAGFTSRINQFLTIAQKHHIRPVFVLFDSCWDPNPRLGMQHPPVPGIHNSGWVQSPGAHALTTPAESERLRDYVQGVLGHFANDPRILAWDLWNEPDNTNASSYGKLEPKDKIARIEELLPKVFAWARATHAQQPLTSGVWEGDWSMDGKPSRMTRIQLEESDIISFHNYGFAEEFAKRIQTLRAYQRPILCTEYMARGVGSLFDTILPIAKREHVGVINWGLVAGKSQTYLPWDSWAHPYINQEPPVWFHDVFRYDGTPYRPAEADQIRALTQGR